MVVFRLWLHLTLLLQLLMVAVQLGREPRGAEDHVVHPLLRAHQSPLQLPWVERLLVHEVVGLLGSCQRPQRLSLRDVWNGFRQEGREDHPLRLEHCVIVLVLEFQQGSPDVLQPHALSPAVLLRSPEHVLDLLGQGSLVLGQRLDLRVRLHEDGQQHVEKQHYHDHHEGKEPTEGLGQPNVLHLVPVPRAEHGHEARVEGAINRGKVDAVLAKEEDRIHRHAEVDGEEDQGKVHQVVPCRLEGVRH
mmetsp:Transcript_71923/g.210704  ORF Transcript_71923/g.210704 Transcript_71923/m.210704 type:complete len:247 (+) Transcript_71923:630-1370(+)